MTTTVFLVRHASHDRLGKTLCGRTPGVSLSEAGRREAAVLGERLAQKAVTALYTSPLERTRETAETIAGRLGLEPRADEDLQEIDFGDWTGKPFAELEGDPAWAAWNHARGLARPPGGESMLEAQARLRRWLDRARAAHPDGRVAAVSHGDPIKALLAHALGLSLDQHDRLEVSPASVSAVAAGDWGMKVLSMNEAAR